LGLTNVSKAPSSLNEIGAFVLFLNWIFLIQDIDFFFYKQGVMFNFSLEILANFKTSLSISWAIGLQDGRAWPAAPLPSS
jgi:hypothetical protein